MTATKPDIIVIGGGAIGVCCAHFLSESGLTVTVLDRGEICSGSSSGNAGLITPSHIVPLASPGALLKGLKWMLRRDSPFYIKPRLDWDLISWLWRFGRSCTEAHLQESMPVLRDLSLASRALYEHLAVTESLEFGFAANGVLNIYRSDEGRADCLQLSEYATALGIDARMLDPAGINALDPNLNTSAAGGVFFPQDANIRPSDFVTALRDRLEHRGVTFSTNTAVTGSITCGRIARRLIRKGMRRIYLRSGGVTICAAARIGMSRSVYIWLTMRRIRRFNRPANGWKKFASASRTCR